MRTTRMFPAPLLLLVGTTLSLGVLGAFVGRVLGILLQDSAALPPQSFELHLLWALGFGLLGGIQGALMAPAALLGQRRAAEPLRGVAGALLLFGSLLTCLVALLLWRGLGAGALQSLALGRGLSFLCAGPLLSYLLTRRSLGGAGALPRPALGAV